MYKNSPYGQDVDNAITELKAAREKYEAVLCHPTDYIIETKAPPLLLG